MSYPHPSTSGPHRALDCYDVLCTVFDQLAADEDAWYDYDVPTRDAHCWYARKVDSQRRTTLARCARVCKAFFTPASAILWRDIDSLAPLISCIRSSDPSSSNVSQAYHFSLACVSHLLHRKYASLSWEHEPSSTPAAYAPCMDSANPWILGTQLTSTISLRRMLSRFSRS